MRRIPLIPPRQLQDDRVYPAKNRFFYTLQHLFVVGLILHILFVFLFALLGIVELMYFNLISVTIFGISLYQNIRDRHALALWLAFAEVNTHAVLAVTYTGWDTGFHYYLLAVAPAVFFHPTWEMPTKLSIAAIPAMLLMSLYVVSQHVHPIYAVAPQIALWLDITNILASLVLLSYLAHFYSRAALISERHLRKLAESFERSAAHDELTGLLNRRAMATEIELEISRAVRNRSSFILAIADIDNFKQINDRFGHQTGDQILRDIARLFEAHFRKHDRIARWGGEEFLILLVDLSAENAARNLEDLQTALRATPFLVGEKPITVNLTIGLCAYHPGMTADACIQAADAALYRGKRSGKDQVVVGEG